MISQAPAPAAPAASEPAEIFDDRGPPAGWIVFALFAFALVVSAYFTFRFGGYWSEGDTGAQAGAIRAIVREATLVPGLDFIYPNGYAFGAISAFVVAFTGLDVATLLQSLFPVVSASLVVVAWPTYRELTGSARGATLATMLLFLQPDFIFVILRGSHERVLRVLLFVSVWLLVRSLRHADRPRAYTTYVVLTYLTAYAIISTNSFFGSSYILALILALTVSWFASFLGPGLASVSMPARHRLLYVTLLCTVLAFVFNTYIYPSAGHTLAQFPSIPEKLYRLFLTASPETSGVVREVAHDPYAVVVAQWIDLRVYFLVSIGTYLLIAASLAIWVRMGLNWLAGKGERPTVGQWFMWLLYAGFAFQGALSIMADRAGALGGNLQYRSFPSFVMVAVPLVGLALARWRPGRIGRLLAPAGFGVLTLLAVAKATNEPSISNKWTFYLPSEVAAIEFLGAHSRDRAYWSDFDERLRAVQQTLDLSKVGAAIGSPSPELRTYMISEITRLRAARMGRPIPPVAGELRIYDNGEAQIYRTRARTPYQR